MYRKRDVENNFFKKLICFLRENQLKQKCSIRIEKQYAS